MSSQNEVPERPTRSLSGKVAIVTGAGCEGDGIGNGRAISILLSEAGASVVCVDLQPSWAEQTVQMIQAEGHGAAISCQGDVVNEDDCQKIVDLAVSRFGRLDILVNNVGIGGAPGTAKEVQLDAWSRGMQVNVQSMVSMAKYSVPAMEKNLGPVRGSIVNMSSAAGLLGGNPHLFYPTSKGAIINMTRAMAAHHGRDGIRVNCVCPGEPCFHSSHLLKPRIAHILFTVGMLYTPMMYSKGMSDEARQARKARNLLGTEGNGWDCGAAVRFLASDEARWITGTTLTVDAGATAAIGTNLPRSASVSG